MASIELTPEKPEFAGGGLACQPRRPLREAVPARILKADQHKVEGQMNEHICATALYYLDSENITSSSLAFRMQTSPDTSDKIMTIQNSFSWLEHVYGTELGTDAFHGSCLQNACAGSRHVTLVCWHSLTSCKFPSMAAKKNRDSRR